MPIIIEKEESSQRSTTLVLGAGIDLTQTADGLPLLETTESPSGPIRNFREIGRTETAVKFGWEISEGVEELWVFLSTPAQPAASDPWSLLTGVPLARLTGDSTDYTIPVPAAGYVTYGRLLPMGAVAVSGRAWEFTVQGAVVHLTQRASIVSTDSNQIVVRVAAANPVKNGDIVIAYDAGSLSVTPSTPYTISSSSVTADIETTGHQDFTITRPAFKGGTGRVTFTASSAGRVPDSDAIDVPAQERDTVPLLLRANIQGSNESQVTVRVAVADPFPQGANTVSIAYIANGTGSVNLSSPQSGFTPTSNIDTTGYVEFIVQRPSSGGGAGRITFTASSNGRISATDAVDIPAVDRAVPTLEVKTTPGTSDYNITWSGTGTVEVSIDGATYAAPAASPITVTRNAPGGVAKIYSFRCTNGGQVVSNTVSVPPKEPAAATAPSIGTLTTSATDYPGDGGGSTTVSWTASNMPGGVTYDLHYKITSGNTSGFDPSEGDHNGITSPYVFTHSFGPSAPQGRLTLQAKVDGITIATKTYDGAFAI